MSKTITVQKITEPFKVMQYDFLTTACSDLDLSIDYLRRQKLPCINRGYFISQVVIKKRNGNKTKTDKQ